MQALPVEQTYIKTAQLFGLKEIWYHCLIIIRLIDKLSQLLNGSTEKVHNIIVLRRLLNLLLNKEE